MVGSEDKCYNHSLYKMDILVACWRNTIPISLMVFITAWKSKQSVRFRSHIDINKTNIFVSSSESYVLAVS